MSARTSWPALAHRNFRLYLFGQGVSIVGSWMQIVAMAWLVYELTGSAVWLGVTAFAGQIPALFLTPLAGCLIDTLDRRRLLYFTQSVSMAQAVALAVLTFSGAVEPWHVVGLSFVLGVANAFDIPTRQSFLSELVGPGPDLANAIAINSSVFNGARVAGPALAGIILGLGGAGVCFLVNAATYVAVLVMLMAMRLPPRRVVAAPLPLLRGLREGLTYAWKTPAIRSLLALIGIFNMAGMAESTLLPMIATSVLHGEAGVLGLLSAAAGMGAFAAALCLAARRSVHELDGWIAAAPLLFGCALVAFSFAGSLWAATLLLAVSGFALLLMTAAANTILQTIVEETKRGRIVSLYSMMVTGLAPVGGLIAGLLADHAGASLTLRLTGVCCLVVAVPIAVRFPRRLAEPATC